jgi:DNA-binding transcriptional regulator YdaS (Cro superfamily)
MDIKEIIARGGGAVALARSLGIKHSSVCGWHQVPVDRLQTVAQATGIPPHLLRPDVFEAVQSSLSNESTRAISRANHGSGIEGGK